MTIRAEHAGVAHASVVGDAPTRAEGDRSGSGVDSEGGVGAETRAAGDAVGGGEADFPPRGHPDVSFGRTGLLLVNLGTPDGYDIPSMRRYLAEFLTDRRVIEWPRLIWYPILYGIVLRTRPRRSGEAYASIWDRERNESPLRGFTRSQSERLASMLSDCDGLLVDWAMRYGSPSIPSRLSRLKEQGCERIVIFPLYPQYSASTTATVCDKAFEAMMKMRWMPAIRIVPAYFDDPVYIDALARSIESRLSSLSFAPEKVIASYHGIPQNYFRQGDPYHCHCQKTSRLLRERLGWSEDFMLTCFQSRFGPEEWLQPYTDETVKRLASEGVKRLAIFNPGFASDCLETLEEMSVEARGIFLEHGGESFDYVPCLNDSDEGMKVLSHIARRELAGWIESS